MLSSSPSDSNSEVVKWEPREVGHFLRYLWLDRVKETSSLRSQSIDFNPRMLFQ